MQRRDFITLLGGAAALWPFAAYAQQAAKLYRIGILSPELPPPGFLDAAICLWNRQLNSIWSSIWKPRRNSCVPDQLFVQCISPLLAQSGHGLLHCTCLLSGVKRTWLFWELRFRGRYWG